MVLFQNLLLKKHTHTYTPLGICQWVSKHTHFFSALRKPSGTGNTAITEIIPVSETSTHTFSLMSLNFPQTQKIMGHS